MIKIFLVEDEVVIRNGIKNSINWAEEGYEFVGEASDGELAYPLILKEKPDILITDIKMPFMDGLELSEAVKKELPNIKILILSGYNDFEYAKRAIGIGITDYMLKPVSAEQLLGVIGEVAEVIRKEQEERDLLKKYEADMQENREHDKYEFLTRILTEHLSMTETLEQGKRLEMDLSAQIYNLILFKITSYGEKEDTQSRQMVSVFVDIEEMLQQRKGVYYFRRGVEGWAILCLAENGEELQHEIDACRDGIHEIVSRYPKMEYFGGIGEPVERLRELRDSFGKAERAFAARFTSPTNQIVSWEELHSDREEEPEVRGLGSVESNRELIAKFLRGGTEEETESFVQAYFDEIPEDNIKSMMMCQYILMDIYISVVTFGESIGLSQEKMQQECGDMKDMKDCMQSTETMKKYVEGLIKGLLRLRDAATGRRYSDIIETAKIYIMENYMTEDISLNTVSSNVGMSPSYFSSIFSQEVGKTFVEYLTETRMEKAKELLMCSSRKTSEIGFDVGYKDSHYFSYIFKKTQGCSPKEYRTRGKVQG